MENELSKHLSGLNGLEIQKKGNLLVSCGDFLHRTSNLVMLRRCFLGDVNQICQNEKYVCVVA